ncbi:conserved exported protein of unknown function [Legionella fallonii LLAP-10]|uniref:DUF3494 domain-containing protein n=2 Tax=Legionella fallonii TaxID=96230 RepID=A0A098G7F1_9GAMM|nr:conserved exported protein of unknown function [Legionella fallonii LLAP-10]
MFKKTQHGAIILGLLLLPLATQAQPCRGVDANGNPFAKCDASFINPPIFGAVCIDGSSTGTFTVRNNTPAPFKINYIRIQDNDALPQAATTIVQGPTNNCVVGSSLASGATCNISVELLPLAAGTFNRILQVGINTRQVEVDAPAITTVVGSCVGPGPTPPPGFTPTIPATPSFLYSSSILAYSTVTNTGPTVVNGDLDLTPGSAVTGFPPGIIINGVQNIDNTTATNVRTAATTYFNQLNALPCSVTFGAGTDISTLSPINCGVTPVLCFTSSALMTGPVVLNGVAGDSCTFKIASTLTVSNGAVMTTAGGISNDNISWAIGSSATLGTNSTLVGIIDASASISLNTGARLNGRAWALNGAVTLDSNPVNPAA